MKTLQKKQFDQNELIDTVENKEQQRLPVSELSGRHSMAKQESVLKGGGGKGYIDYDATPDPIKVAVNGHIKWVTISESVVPQVPVIPNDTNTVVTNTNTDVSQKGKVLFEEKRPLYWDLNKALITNLKLDAGTYSMTIVKNDGTEEVQDLVVTTSGKQTIEFAITPSSDQDIKVIAVNKSGPEVKPAGSGAFNWGVNFKTNLLNGYIVQEIKSNFTVKDKSGKSLPAPVMNAPGSTHYWEAWKVINGVVQKKGIYDDSWQWDEIYEVEQSMAYNFTEGNWKIEGNLFWVDKLLPADGWNTGSINNGKTTSGGLDSTTKQPSNLSYQVGYRIAKGSWDDKSSSQTYNDPNAFNKFTTAVSY